MRVTSLWAELHCASAAARRSHRDGDLRPSTSHPGARLPDDDRRLRPARALRTPLWLGALLLLALNDHVWKGGGFLPPLVTGKLSDLAGMVVAPALLATLLRVRSPRGLAACHLATGAVFSAIKTSALASSSFSAALAVLGVSWRNWCDPTDLLALPMLWVSWHWLVPAMRATADKGRAFSRLAVLLGVPVVMASGENLGGANQGGKAPGNGKSGVDLAVGDIAVEPSGQTFLSRKDGALLIGDLQTRTVHQLSGMPSPDRVAFWAPASGRGFFLLGGTHPETLVSYDLATDQERWRVQLQRTDQALSVSDAGDRVILSDPMGLVVLSAADGSTVASFGPSEGVVDVQADGAADRLTIVGNTVSDESTGARTATIYVRKISDGSATCQVTVPNCADRLVLAPGSTRAFLAPTTCSRDPVSVVDVATCTFEKNLPGFGPVALSQNGRTAVAFVDRDQQDPMAPPLPPEVVSSSDRYHLLFLDVTTLAYGTLPIGDVLPRYAVTPDGKLLLVDSYFDGNDSKLRLVDAETRAIREVTGPRVELVDYVLLPDSTAAYALWGGLMRIDTQAATASTVPLGFVPSALNIVPGGKTLLLKDESEHVELYDVEGTAITGVVR